MEKAIAERRRCQYQGISLACLIISTRKTRDEAMFELSNCHGRKRRCVWAEVQITEDQKCNSILPIKTRSSFSRMITDHGERMRKERSFAAEMSGRKRTNTCSAATIYDQLFFSCRIGEYNAVHYMRTYKQPC